MKGVLELDYAFSREKRFSFQYRLKRRTYEVIKAINKFFPSPAMVLDLGTAEGRMLQELKSRYPNCVCTGIDYSHKLLVYGAKKYPQINLICADIQNLSFLKSEMFDVLIAMAVIEHLKSPLAMLKESGRLLKRGGIIIISSPHPLWEKISSNLGLLVKEKHQTVMKAREILNLCQKAGLNILGSKGFMISPIGMIGELFIEEILKKLKLDKFLPNQLIVAQK